MRAPSRPILHALSKLPVAATVQLPQVSDFPPGVTWGGRNPPEPSFDRFYNERVNSMLTIPSRWHGYEFEQDFGHGIKAQNVICGKEDVQKNGFFETGVTFTVMKTAETSMAEKLAEGLRHTTLNEVHRRLGGVSEWISYGDTAQICSIRYVAQSPEVQFHTGAVAPSRYMIYVQDLFFEKESGLVFRMKYECPEELFEQSRKTCETIKTGGYFVLDSKGANGIAFLEL